MLANLYELYFQEKLNSANSPMSNFHYFCCKQIILSGWTSASSTHTLDNKLWTLWARAILSCVNTVSSRMLQLFVASDLQSEPNACTSLSMIYNYVPFTRVLSEKRIYNYVHFCYKFCNSRSEWKEDLELCPFLLQWLSKRK